MNSTYISISVVISLIALAASFSTILVLYRNRLETNRPIVTALLESDAGNILTPLTLRIYNTGNTPALDVILHADEKDIINALDDNAPNIYKKDVYRSLSKENIIPVIHNGANVHNAFGLLSKNNKNTFKSKSAIPIIINYKNLYGHKYRQKQILIVRITENFAGSGWSKV